MTREGKFDLHVLEAAAELERALIRERTRAGLQAAETRCRVGGNSWDSFAKVLGRTGRPWTADRLSCGVRRLVATGLADGAPIESAPRRQPKDAVRLLVTGIENADRARSFYGLPPNAERIALRRERWMVPAEIATPAGALRPFLGGERLDGREAP
jgi:hypothetical protein